MWRTYVRMVFTRRPVAEAISPTVLPSAGNAATRLSIGVRPRIAASTPRSIRCRDPGGRHAEVLVRHPYGRAATLLRRSTSGVSLPGTRPAPTSVCVQSQSPSVSLLRASASSGSPSSRRTERSMRSTRRPKSASPAASGPLAEVKQGGRADRRGLGVLHDALGQALHDFLSPRHKSSQKYKSRPVRSDSRSPLIRCRGRHGIPLGDRPAPRHVKPVTSVWATPSRPCPGRPSGRALRPLTGTSGERCGGCVCHATGGAIQQLAYRTGYL